MQCTLKDSFLGDVGCSTAIERALIDLGRHRGANITMAP